MFSSKNNNNLFSICWSCQ